MEKRWMVYFSIIAVFIYLLIQLVNIQNKVSDMEKALGTGYWGNICYTEEISQGRTNYGSAYFVDRNKCEDNKKTVNVWVKEDILPQVDMPVAAPTMDFIPKSSTNSQNTNNSVEQEKAPKITAISDNLGNRHEIDCIWYATHYECFSKNYKEIEVSVLKIPELIFTVEASDPNGKTLYYGFNYMGGCDWSTKNSCTTKLETSALGLRSFNFFVRNDDAYGSIGLDANALLYYRIMD